MQGKIINSLHIFISSDGRIQQNFCLGIAFSFCHFKQRLTAPAMWEAKKILWSKCQGWRHLKVIRSQNLERNLYHFKGLWLLLTELKAYLSSLSKNNKQIKSKKLIIEKKNQNQEQNISQRSHQKSRRIFWRCPPTCLSAHRWDLSMPSLPAAVKYFCQRRKFLHFHSFFVFLSLKMLKLGEVDGVKFSAWKSGGVKFWTNLMSVSAQSKL